MTYTPPTSPVEASWVGQRAYKPPTFYIRATWSADSTQWIYQPPGVAAPVAAIPAARLSQHWVLPSGVAPLQLGRVAVWGQRKSAYNPAQFHRDASWFGANAYAPGIGYVRGSWDLRITYVAPGSFTDEAFGTPHLYGTQFIRPSAWDSYQSGANHYALHSYEYAPPQWVLNASWVGADPYAPVTGVLPAAWALPAENKQVSLAGWSSSVVATGASVISWRAIAYPLGIAAPAVSNPNVRNGAAAVLPGGFNALTLGAARIWNRRQYLLPGGFTLTLPFGTAYVQGGVRIVTPTGIAALGMGAVTVINTTANQTISPAGLNALAVGSPWVSPRYLFAAGILGTSFGTLQVQRQPKTSGWDSARWGIPTVIYKTRYVRPGSIDQSESGFPRVFDRAQRIRHTASPVTSLFGDVVARLKNLRIAPQGFDALNVSPWAEARNQNRYLLAGAIAPAPVSAAQIRNKTPSIAPAGLASQAIGLASVGYAIRSVRPSGVAVPFPGFGVASLWRTPSLEPAGIPAPAIPLPTIWPAVRRLEHKGSDTSLYGKPTVWFGYRAVAPQGLGSMQSGIARLEHGNRTLRLEGRAYEVHGNAWVSFGLRALAPISITPPSGGAQHMVGGLRFIGAAGFEATRWGTRIIPVARTLAPLGFAEVFGWPALRNKHQYLAPTSIRLYQEPQQHFGKAKFYNLRQHITQDYAADNDLNPPAWPMWMLIENRNKLLRVTGWQATRYGTQQVDNHARQLLPSGVPNPALPEFQKAGMVAYAVRPLHIDGLEPPYIGGWSAVRNVAVLIKPAGRDAALYGLAKIENTTRAFNRIGGFDSAWFGYPFVAPRVRALTFESRYSIGPLRTPEPVVQLSTRYIVDAGRIAPKEVGAHSLVIHWTIITPRWTLQNLYGFPVVRNLTPEVGTRGRNSEEFGDTHLRLQWRPIAPVGEETTLMGRTKISDRKQSIQVAGTNMLRIGDKLVVIRTGIPPLAKQWIWLDSLDPGQRPNDGHGIPTPGYPQSQVGTPVMQQQVIYVHEIDPQTKIGQPLVTANSIRVEPGIFELTVGEPEVSLRVRKLLASSILSLTELGRPRLSPHTIYAVMEAPKQAKDNHPVPNLHYVLSQHVFGRVNVENRQRSLAVYWPADTMAFGQTKIYNRRQYIRPVGPSVLRFGWPSLPGDTLIEFFTTINTMAMGVPKVAPPPYIGPLYVKPSGLSAFRSGNNWVDHRNRTVRAAGFLSQSMGTGLPGDTPYQWRGLRVGPLMPTIPTGIESQVFGKTWISHWVRGLEPQGFDSFLCEYDYQAFNKRMRVRNATTNNPGRKIVLPRGEHVGIVGTPGIRPGVHFIRPDGNSDQYRKGAF